MKIKTAQDIIVVIILILGFFGLYNQYYEKYEKTIAFFAGIIICQSILLALEKSKNENTR